MTRSKLSAQLVHFTTADVVDNFAENAWWWKGPGWYFQEAEGDMNGPHATEEQAMVAEDKYLFGYLFA